MENNQMIPVAQKFQILEKEVDVPENLNILMVTKKEAELSDSFLAQGGICMLRNEEDYDSYFEDTMKAGHYENDAY